MAKKVYLPYVVPDDGDPLRLACLASNLEALLGLVYDDFATEYPFDLDAVELLSEGPDCLAGDVATVKPEVVWKASQIATLVLCDVCYAYPVSEDFGARLNATRAAAIEAVCRLVAATLDDDRLSTTLVVANACDLNRIGALRRPGSGEPRSDSARAIVERLEALNIRTTAA